MPERPLLEYSRDGAKAWYAYRTWQGIVLAVLTLTLIALLTLVALDAR